MTISITERTTKLGNIAQSVTYGLSESAIEEPIGPKFLRITDIQDNQVDWNEVPFCKCDEKSRRKADLKPGDIVFARTGATTGKSFLIKNCPKDSVFASYLIRLRLKKTVIPSYLAHYFQSPSYWQQIMVERRGVAQPGVNASKLKELQVPLPPLEEQRRIAEILDLTDGLRAKRREALAEVEELTQAVFGEMFGDGKDCVYRTVQELLDNGSLARVQDGNHGELHPKSDEFQDSGIPFVMARDLKNGRVCLDSCVFLTPERASSLRIGFSEKGDVLLSHKGTVGEVAVVQDSLEQVVLSPQVTYYRTNQDLLNPRFLAGAFLSTAFQRTLVRRSKQSTRSYIGITAQRKLEIPLPPISLQHKFAERVEAIEKLKASHQRSLEEMDALFASLQSRAFKGEL